MKNLIDNAIHIFAYEKKKDRKSICYENNSVKDFGGYENDTPVSSVSYMKKDRNRNIALNRIYHWIFLECELKK